LPENKKFTIIANQNSDDNIYIQSVQLNGEDYKFSYITHKDIMQGGEIIFNMGPKPNMNFGLEKKYRPQSIVY
jgi:putative alpha-1,2-mannosidase